MARGEYTNVLVLTSLTCGGIYRYLTVNKETSATGVDPSAKMIIKIELPHYRLTVAWGLCRATSKTLGLISLAVGMGNVLFRRMI